MSAAPLTTPQQLTLALHRAVVEVYTLRQARQPLSQLSRAPINQGDFTGDVQVTPSADPVGVNLTYQGDVARDLILSSLSNNNPNEISEEDLQFEEASPFDDVQEEEEEDPDEPEKASMKDPTIETSEKAADLSELDELISSWDPGWLSIPLSNLDIKFAVCILCGQQQRSHY